MSQKEQYGTPVGFRTYGGPTDKNRARRRFKRMQNASLKQTHLLYKVEGLGIIQRTSLNQSQALLSDSIKLLQLQILQLKEMQEQDEQTNKKLKKLAVELERQEIDNSFLKKYFNDLNSGIQKYESQKPTNEISLTKIVPEIILNRSIAEVNLTNAKKCLSHLENMLKVRKVRYLDSPAAQPKETLLKKDKKRTIVKSPRKDYFDKDFVEIFKTRTKLIVKEICGNKTSRPSGPYKVPILPHNYKNSTNMSPKPKRLDEIQVIPRSGGGNVTSESCQKEKQVGKDPMERHQQSQHYLGASPSKEKHSSHNLPNKTSEEKGINSLEEKKANVNFDLSEKRPEPTNVQDQELVGANKANKYTNRKFTKKAKRRKSSSLKGKKGDSQPSSESGNFLAKKYGSIGRVLPINAQRKKRNKRRMKSRLKKYLRTQKIPMQNNLDQTKDTEVEKNPENDSKVKSTGDLDENLDDETKTEPFEPSTPEPKLKATFLDQIGRPSMEISELTKRDNIESTAIEIINLLFEEKTVSIPPPSDGNRELNVASMSMYNFVGKSPAAQAKEVWTDLVEKFRHWKGKLQSPHDADMVRTILKERYVHNVQKFLHNQVKDMKTEMNLEKNKSQKPIKTDAKDQDNWVSPFELPSNSLNKAPTKKLSRNRSETRLSHRKASNIGPELIHYTLLNRQMEKLNSSISDKELESMGQIIMSRQVPESDEEIQLFKKYDSDPTHWSILIMSLDGDQSDKDFVENIRIQKNNYEFIKRSLDATARRKRMTDMSARSQELRRAEENESRYTFHESELQTIVFDNAYMTKMREHWAAYIAKQAKTPMEIQLAKIRRQKRREEAKKRAEARRQEKLQEKATGTFRRSPSALYRNPRQTNRLRKAIKDIHEEQKDQETPRKKCHPCSSNAVCDRPLLLPKALKNIQEETRKTNHPPSIASCSK